MTGNTTRIGKTMSRQSPSFLTTEKLLRCVRVMFRGLLRTSEASQHVMSIEQQIAMGPKRTLMLVNCAGRRFLLAMAGDSVTAPVEVGPVAETCPSARIAVIGYLGDKP